MTVSIRFAKLLTATLVSLCAVPQIAFAINKCGGNVYATDNLGLVTHTPYNACPTGDVQISPRCTTLTFSKTGPFSIQVAFNYEPECPAELYEVTFNGSYAISGFVALKYQIVGVDFAPPGAKSYVNYGASAMRGTGSTNSESWSNTVSLSIAQGIGADLFGVSGADLTATFTTSYTQESDSTSSISISTTTTDTDIIYGPASSAVGVDHSYDVVWVWLNPASALNVTGTSALQWAGYAYNEADDAGEMEVIPLYVSWLQNPSTIPADVAARLARSWDKSGLGGLTSVDYAAILAADPFMSTSYNPTTDPNHRFDLQAGYTFPYEPPPAGGQPLTQGYSVSTQTTSSQGQGASYTYSVGLAFDLTTNASLIASVKSDTKISDTYTTVDKWSSSINSATGKTATLSITGPAVSDNYKGPVEFQVWRDNIYGSFMFYPVD